MKKNDIVIRSVNHLHVLPVNSIGRLIRKSRDHIDIVVRGKLYIGMYIENFKLVFEY